MLEGSYTLYQTGSIVQIQEVVIVLTPNISASIRNLFHLIVSVWR